MSAEELVKHTFFDPVKKEFYYLMISIETQDEIKRNKAFAAEMFEIAKACCQELGHKNTQVMENSNPSEHSSTAYRPKNDSYQWEYASYKALIASYASHREELEHHKHRKHFWDNVTDDLISQKYPVNKAMCEKQWNKLHESYKQSLDKSGRAPSEFQFFTEVDEILGDKPSNSTAFTLSSLHKKDKENDGLIFNDESNTTVNKINIKGRDTKRKEKNYTDNDEHEIIKKRKKKKITKQDLELRKLDLKEKKMELDKKRVQLMQQYLDLKK